MADQVSKEFMLERYKYILGRKIDLNKATFTVVSIYQGGLALIFAGHYSVATAAAKGDVSADFALLFARGLFLSLIVLTAFSVLMIAGGVSAWYGYRCDEARIERDYLGVDRRLPRFLDVLKWYETYFSLAMIAVLVSYGVFFKHIVSLSTH